MDMAMVMPQTPKAQANVASAQKTTNNEVAPKPVTFNTVSNTTNNVQEKTVPAVQPQTTETVNNEAAVKPQQPVASQSVAQGSAKTISTPPANEQNASVEKTVTEKQTVAQPQAKSNVQQNNFATTSQTAQTTPKETFHQTVTFHDDVTGASKTVTTQINGNKGDEYDVYNTDLSLPNGYYLDCSNIAKGNPNTITQDNEKFNYNIVNPYNVVKGDFNTDIGGLNGKDFPAENQLYGNSITHPTIPMIAPGLGCWDLMKIMFVDQNGKQVGTQTVDPTNYNDVENDWADYAFKVTAPNGYKFVDPRENFVAFTAPLGRGTNTAKMQNGYMVYPVETTTTNNNTSGQSNNDLPINKGGYKLQLTGPKGNQTATLSYNGSTLRTFKNINSVTSNSNQVILLSDNEQMLTYITQPDTDSISIKDTETKKGAISDAKSFNAQIVYVGNNKPNVKDTDPVDDFSYVKKDGTGYVLITEHPGSDQMTYTKGVRGTALGTAPNSISQIVSMSSSNPGADITVKLQGGKQVDLRYNWLAQNTSSNTNKPASNTGNNGSSQSKPATGSNASGSTNNKPNSTTKPAGTTGNTTNGSTNKPADSSTANTNKPTASSNTNSNKPTNGSTSVNANKPATSSSISGNKPAANSNSNGNNSSAGSSTTNGNKPANGSTSSNTSADKPASSSSTANTNKPSTNSNGSSSSQAGNDSTSTSANKPANTSSSSAEQPIKVTVHYIGQDGKIVGTVVDTIQPGSTLDVSKNVPKGYEVSSAFKPQTGVQADNDQATLNVPVVPVGQNGKASQANDKSSVNNTPNNGKKNAAQANNTQKSNDKQKATDGIQAQEKGNTQSLNVNSDRNASEGVARQNVSANSNPVPTFNVAGNASQAASIAQATGNGQSGVQGSALASVVQSNQASSASPSNSGSSANALPETGMANEGIAFAAAMLALAGLTMIKHEHEE